MPKVRFAILQSGIEKQLFSVEEHKNGDLTFGLPHYPATRYRGRRLPSSFARKLSVHLSPKSDPPAHTITHEILFRNRLSHKGHAVPKRREGTPFIWPLFIEAVGKACKPFPQKPSVAKDEKLQVAAYDAGLDTLMIAAFVSDSDYEFPPACGLSIASKQFRCFRVSLIYNFATIPSPMNCFDEVVYTSSVTGTGSNGILGNRESVYSETIDAVEPFLIERFVPLANMIRQRRSSILLPPTAADVQMIRFPRNPSDGFTAEELTYGANPILGARRNPLGLRMGSANVLNGVFATFPPAREMGQWTLRRTGSPK